MNNNRRLLPYETQAKMARKPPDSDTINRGSGCNSDQEVGIGGFHG
jgi:hypothetical protein